MSNKEVKQACMGNTDYTEEVEYLRKLMLDKAELKQEVARLKLEYRLQKIKLRDDPKYEHLKTKVAKQEQITIDLEPKKQELINKEYELDKLSAIVEERRLHLLYYLECADL